MVWVFSPDLELWSANLDLLLGDGSLNQGFYLAKCKEILDPFLIQGEVLSLERIIHRLLSIT